MATNRLLLAVVKAIKIHILHLYQMLYYTDNILFKHTIQASSEKTFVPISESVQSSIFCLIVLSRLLAALVKANIHPIITSGNEACTTRKSH